jgi:hypothetical protein
MVGDRPNVRSAVAVVRREISDGGATALVAQFRRTSSGSRASSWPPWCGSCSDELIRQRENGQGQVYRCPVCHPLVMENAKHRLQVTTGLEAAAAPDELPDRLPADWGEWPA